ncbi:serine/threonine-protein kinase [Nocardioides sediminis]|uniref:serine/threonine-protein kinase n=1 Tax=Nocardioides sediminis TaxID=433648 RepID=UPI000D3094E2|nr:serine/threonine-protein kinase [Nocardioides sediminis]
MTTPPTGPSNGPAPERFADDAHRYALTSRIATGGMGEVWRGTDTVLSRPVAIKVLKPEYADDALFRTRFETEARHAASLHHPGIAGVFDFGEAAPVDGSTTPRPFLVMELVEGQPLSNLLRPDAPMDPAVVSDLLAQAADALGAAHAAGIVHRDVKPGNLIVTPDRRTKVTDFGIARAAQGMSLTETGQVLGTPAYISPEQAEGKRATAASDVYALGVVAFECLAGRKPFLADTPVATAIAHLREPVPDLPDSVPGDLAAVVRRSMAKGPAERYADGAALAAALRDPSGAAAAGGATVVAPVVAGPSAPADEEPTRTQVIAPVPAAAAATPAVGAAAAGGSSAGDGDGRRPRGGLPRWVPLALLGVALLVVALVLVQALGDDGTTTDDTPPRETPTRTGSPSPQEEPTQAPSEEPAETQTEEPAQTPTETATEPTTEPSPTETETPTETSTGTPTGEPTQEPTEAPLEPTTAPTTPTDSPT